MEANRYPEALALFEKLRERDPNFGPLHYKLSQLYASTGRFADAVREMSPTRSGPRPGDARPIASWCWLCRIRIGPSSL